MFVPEVGVCRSSQRLLRATYMHGVYNFYSHKRQTVETRHLCYS